jgi:hypothetical protein
MTGAQSKARAPGGDLGREQDREEQQGDPDREHPDAGEKVAAALLPAFGVPLLPGCQVPAVLVVIERGFRILVGGARTCG